MSTPDPSTRLPLNSRRLTGQCVKRIGHALGVPTAASTAEVLQMIEAKLVEDDHEPRNVLVVLDALTPSSRIFLEDSSGEFLEIEPEEEQEERGAGAEQEQGAGVEEDDDNSSDTMESLRLALTAVQEENSALKTEVSDLNSQLSKEKDRYKALWKVNCESTIQYDLFLSDQEHELSRLRNRILELEGGTDPRRVAPGDCVTPIEVRSNGDLGGTGNEDASSRSSEDSGHVTSEGSKPKSVARRGKAPPIDPFTGESPSLRLEEWLPALERASQWNGWTEADQLLQLAGHLRGKALQEWNLLEERDKSTMSRAVEALKKRLDPGSKALAALEFKHMTQRSRESIGDFITRLEKTYRLAYGREALSKETRDALLFAQMQDGLKLELMQAPAVSGAQCYEQLCVCAKNEERRLSALKKRQELTDGKAGQQSSNPRSKRPATGDQKTSTEEPLKRNKKCYTCGKTGHFAKDCRQKKTESGGSRSQGKPAQRPVANQVHSTTNVSQDEATESLDPRNCLLSSESEEETEIKQVRVRDTGSKAQRASVDIQGVPTLGVIDSGADITIIGGELFKKVASVAKLRKRDFRKPDRTPRTYDQRPFVLHGCMDLDITFDGKTMSTPVYIKMDSPTPLLLSEGVCRQLGILSYHPSIEVVTATAGYEQATSENQAHETTVVAEVPTVRVMLTQSVKLLPQKTCAVQVELQTEQLDGSFLVQPSKTMEAGGVHFEDGLLLPTTAPQVLLVSNRTGFAQELTQGQELGVAAKVEVIADDLCVKVHEEAQEEPQSDAVRRVTGDGEDRQTKLVNLYRDCLDLPEEEKGTFCDFLAENHMAFCLEDGERGETDLVQLHIDTGDAPPRKQAPRRMPFAVRREVEKQVKKMKEAGIIQKSHSSWSSPVILVRKRNGSYRFCVDYRRLNDVTKKDTFPLPRIDDLLDQLSQSKYFSTLDLAAGYWQIQVAPGSQPKTAFTTHQGLYEFRVMPFGLTNAPAVFQRLVQEVLEGLNPEGGPDFVSAYIDDILVFSRTLEEHMEHLRLVIDRVTRAGLKLNPAKCKFIQQEVEYLGHLVTPQGLKTSTRHIEAVEQFPVPTTVTGVRQFLGLTSYYRRFVESFAKIASPLHALTKKNARFRWNEKCQTAFDHLKKRLVNAPILAYPSFDREFLLETDASVQGLGAVLSQVQDDGLSHPVAYASRALSPAEKNYGITDLETLAVVWSVSHFKAYLYGQRVKVFTDHTAVKAVLQNPNASGKHARWWSLVFESGVGDVNICYKRGRDNLNADALSRSPCEGILPEEVDIGVSVFAIEDHESVERLLVVEPFSPDLTSVECSLGDEQYEDPEIKEIIDYLRSKELPQDDKRAKALVLRADKFVTVDGILYFLDGKNNQRAVVPKRLREDLIKQFHSGPFAGHFAGPRIYGALAPKFWWEGMYPDVVNHCRKCPQCITVAGGQRIRKPPLQPIPVQRPFQLLGVDVMDLPVTESGNKHVLVFQDFLSKWPLVFPIPDQKSWRIVDILVKEIIPSFGVPEGLLSDRGTNLLSFLMKDVCDLLGITKINTTAYHPQCNGLVERFNRTLKQMLRKHVEKRGRQWDTCLHGLLWAYRNTPHESTGEKPSFLLFGRDLRSPSEAAFLPPQEIEDADVTDYRLELATSLKQARELAAVSIQQAQQRYKKYYDRKSGPSILRKSDWVMIRFPQDETGAGRKLSRPWHGPYRVLTTSETGITAEKVYAPQDGQIQVHLNRVTRCPRDFPAGYFWYGPRRQGPGRPPKWLEKLQSQVAPEEQTSKRDMDLSQDRSDPTSEVTDSLAVENESDPEVRDADSDRELNESTHGDTETKSVPMHKTRTRIVKPPDRLMLIEVARDELL